MSTPNLWVRVMTLRLVAGFASDAEPSGLSRRSIDDVAASLKISPTLAYRFLKEASYLGIARAIPGRRVMLSAEVSALVAPFEWRALVPVVPLDWSGRDAASRALLSRARAVVSCLSLKEVDDVEEESESEAEGLA